MPLQIQVPFNWRPRDYQLPAWSYLERGGTRADLCWHRRSGKDEVSLHWTCVDAIQRPGVYWHMLPQAAQARKAIWTAINPHTGRKRIDEAFPREIRRRTRDNEMQIELINGAVWQVVGSDNFNSLVGAPPRGVVFSEWSLANPQAWAFIRPILLENGGWCIRIYTPRGKNHAWRTYESARKNPDWFDQRLTVDDTQRFTPAQLAAERQELIDEFGETEGEAFFQQEYHCSFDAAILGSVYGAWMAHAEREKRIGEFPYDPSLPVFTAWDLGYDDLTAIWWFQISGNELHLIDYYQNNGKDVAHYAEVLWSKPYDYKNSKHYGPHDAANKLLAAGGRSVVSQLDDEGISMVVIAATSVSNSIAAVRKTLGRTWINEGPCEVGIDALKQYHFKWDPERRILSAEPVHDWSSHPCDALEIAARVWREEKTKEQPKEPTYAASSEGQSGQSVQAMIAAARRKRRGE